MSAREREVDALVRALMANGARVTGNFDIIVNLRADVMRELTRRQLLIEFRAIVDFPCDACGGWLYQGPEFFNDGRMVRLVERKCEPGCPSGRKPVPDDWTRVPSPPREEWE